MNEGDPNTRTFHARATQMHRRKQFHRLFDADGNCITYPTHISNMRVNFFEAFFKSSNPKGEDMDRVLHSVAPKVYAEMNASLTKEVSNLAIYEVV